MPSNYPRIMELARRSEPLEGVSKEEPTNLLYSGFVLKHRGKEEQREPIGMLTLSVSVTLRFKKTRRLHST